MQFGTRDAAKSAAPPPPDFPYVPDRSLLDRTLRITAVIGLSTLGTVAILSYLLPGWTAGILLLLVLLGTFLLGYRWDLTRDRAFLGSWVGVSLVVAVVSLVTGWHNGLTDEPFVTPAFAQLWPNLYGGSISVTYDQYGAPLTLSNLYNVYLPGLAFAEIPGISYKWTSVAAWAASLYLLRRRGESIVLWGGAWVGLLAANGFNDFVPCLALTLTFVTLVGTPSKVAEIVSLALKQFANLVVVAVHLYHRRWRDALLAVVVTAAILAPFAYLSPGGVVCHVLLVQPGECSRGAGTPLGPGFVHHINYLLWPLFAIAVFGPGYLRSLRTAGPGGVRGKVGRFLRRWSRPNRGPTPPPPSAPT
ncbi:MAG: hypothetical protein L3K02_01675 [Thermoplasmata archaeon]|nr:hypothetical protein [Thermoplasmata archaeon]